LNRFATDRQNQSTFLKKGGAESLFLVKFCLVAHFVGLHAFCPKNDQAK
jgi:hypothetical protein